MPWIASACVALAALGLVAYLKTCQGTHAVVTTVDHTVTTIAKAAPEIAARFKTGTISHTFSEMVTSIEPTRGDVLETAVLNTQETFRHEDTRRAVWDLIYLGRTTSEIRCPVTFRYHVRLTDSWRMATRDHTCLVLAPAVRPSLPPAIHTDRMEKSSDAGWLRFNATENLQQLESGLTPELEKRAGDPNHQSLAREACRQAVAQFVKTWLLKEDFWREDRLSSVIVIFPEEAGFATDAELESYKKGQPTIVLQKK